MEIKIPTDFLSLTKDKYLLLDTNVFIDTLIHPEEFTRLFAALDANNTTLVTLKFVFIRVFKGCAN